MGVGTLSIASGFRIQIENNTMDSFRWVHIESFRRRSLVPVRYTATKSLGCYSFPVKLF